MRRVIFGIHTFPHSHIILEKGAYTDMRVVGVAQQPMVRSRLLVVLMAIFQKVACFQPIQVRTSNNFAAATRRRSGSAVAVVTELSSADEFDKALRDAGEMLVVVDFSTTTCGPCKLIEPGFVTLSEAYEDYSFYKVLGDKSDEARALFDRFSIKSVPQFRFFTNGQCRTVITGGVSTVELIDAIEAIRWEPGAPSPPKQPRRPRHTIPGVPPM